MLKWHAVNVMLPLRQNEMVLRSLCSMTMGACWLMME